MQYRVVFHPAAQAELDELYDWIADRTIAATAWNYVSGIKAFCEGLATFPRRGTERVDIMNGLRVVGYRRSVSIAFAIEDDLALVLGIFYGGREINAKILAERV